MNRKMKQEKLAKQISLALMAGMVTYTPVAFGMPVVDQIKTSQTTISDPTVEAGITVIDINGTGNNVINWKDFSIDHGEKVRFDNGGNVNNYANIVTGSATSFINGAMEGGNNVYLINPNGVIFGKGAEVNVGNLYVSTQGGLNDADYDDVTSAFTSPVTTTVASDVVNLGNIEATAVEVVGNNIRFLNTADIDAFTVNIKASGYVHLGHSVGSEATEVNDTHYKNETVATPTNYTVTELDGQTTKTADNYMLVRNRYELQNIKNNTSANYMLADDINKNGSAATFAPIANYTGDFDGMFYEICNLNISAGATGTGLFASASNGRIENVGLRDVTVNGPTGSTNGSGGFAGEVTDEVIKNVYNVSDTCSIIGNKAYTGSFVGKVSGTTTISNAYNTAHSQGGGIIGYAQGNLTIENVYNKGKFNGNYGFIYSDTAINSLHVTDCYIDSDKTNAEFAKAQGAKTTFTNSYINPTSTQASGYSNWSISDTGGVKTTYNYDDNGNITGIKSVTKPTWRIYAGQSLPMLTAFFKGTVQADYNFTMGDPDTTGFAGYNLADAPHTDQAYETNRYWTDDQGNVVTTYNGQIVAATPTTGTSFASLIGTGDNDIKYNAKTSANADRGTDASSSYALYSSGQLGYDVAGSNFTVEKRKVIGTSSTSEVTIPASKVYDGTSSVDIDGDISTSFSDPTGITGIVDDDDVSLSGHVQGTMYESKSAYKAATDKSTVEVVDVNTEGKYYARLSFDSLALSGANKDNYELTVTSGSNVETEDASITPKELYVSLNQATGLNKTYDGTTDIKNTDYGWVNVVTDDSGKITAERIHKGETSARADEVSIMKGNDTDNPVKYADKNAGEQDVVYSGLVLAGKEKNNYVLKYKDGETVVGPVANGTITAKGTISPKEINMASAVNSVTKEYDGNSDYTGAITLKDTQPTDGIISGDSIAFTIVGNGTFKEADGTTTTGHAGGDHAAAKVSYTVQVAGSDASNYKINDTTLADGTQVAGVVSDGTITKKALNVSYDTTKPVLKRVYNGVSAVVGGTITEDDVKGRIIATGWVGDDETALAGTVVNTADYVNSTGTADSHVAVDTNGNVTTKNVRYLLNNLDDYTYSGTGLGTANVSGTDYTTLTAENAGKITQKALTVNFGEQTKQYDGTIAVTRPITGTLEGFVNKSDRDTITLDVTGASGTYNNGSDVAGYADGTDKVTYTGVTLTGTNNDYSLPVDMKGNGTITARVLHNDSNDFGVDWDALNPIIKTYDGNDKVKGATGYESEVYGTNAVTSTNFIDKLYAARVSGDGPIAFKVASAVYDTKHAGEGKPVTYNLTIDKSQFSSNSNYDVSGITGDTISITKETTGKITQKVITASISNTHTTKTYDGDEKVKNGDAEVTGADLVSLDLAEGDTNNSRAAYYYVNGVVNTTTKNASSNTVAGAQGILYTIAIDDGNRGNNYTISNATNNQLTGDGVINKADLSLAFAAPTKDYDTTTTATVAVTPTELKGSDTFTAASVTGTYGKGTTANWEADANAGTDKLVKYTGIDTALGDNYGNYNVTYGTETVVNGVAYSAGTINKLNLTSGMITSNIDAVTKTYDGTANVNHFDGSTTKTAEEYFGLKVTINGDVQDWKNSAAKTYFKTVTGAYDTKNAGENKSVTYTVELADDLAANINLDSAALSDKLTSMNNTITKRQVGTVTAAPATGTSIDKVYDGSDSVDASTVSLTYDHDANINTSITGILASDYAGGSGVTVSSTGSTYASKRANWNPTKASSHDGSNTVTVNMSLANNTAGNYELTSGSATVAGNIQKKELTVSVKDSADLGKTYDATTNLKNDAKTYLDLNGSVVSGDSVALDSASGSYDKKDAGARTVTFKGFKLGDADAGNYYVSTTSLQGSGTIAQKVIDAGKVKADGGALSKVYDGSTDATAAIVGKTLTSEGFITGDDVSLTATGAEYDAATVAGATTVTYSGVSLGGASAANYKIDSTTLTGDGTITPKKIKAIASGSVTGKKYDGKELSLSNLNVQLDENDIVTQEGKTEKDDVSLSVTIKAKKGGYDVEHIKDAGTYSIEYKDPTLAGTTAGNYELDTESFPEPPDAFTIEKAVINAAVADGAIREYDGTKTKTDNVGVTFTDFIEDDEYGVTAGSGTATLVGTYGNWDATSGFAGDNNVSRQATTTNYVPVEGETYGYKAINYGGFDTAVVNALKNSGVTAENAVKASQNYTLGDVTGANNVKATVSSSTAGLDKTAYFKEADKMGYLTPIAITAASVKEKWSDIEKVYDGKTSVNDPLDKFTLYYDKNNNGTLDQGEGSIAYSIVEGGSTVYNSADVATANTVTYRGVKVNEDTALTDNPNYEMASDIFDKYNGAIDDTHAISVTNGTTKVAINKRGLYVNPTTNTPEKIYDGKTAVNNPSNYVELVKTKSGDTGVIGTDDVAIDTLGITGAYDDINAGENKDVTYSGLALTGAKAGNYKIINAAGTETATASGKGKITRREIEVSIKNRDVQKVYDSTSNVLKDNDNVTVNQAFQYSTDAADTDGKNLVTATVTGGQITYDTANNKIIYTPTAGTGVVEVQLEKATFTKDGTATANAGTGLGIDYVLSYDPKNIVLVHTTADGDKISLTPAENSRMSATLRGDNIGTITQREIKLNDIYAEKIYDGTEAVTGLNGDEMTVHDAYKNVDLTKGKLVGNDTVNDLGITVTGGKYDAPNAADNETQDKKDHTVSDVTFTISNSNYKLVGDQPTDGTGVIKRKTITANPTTVKTAPGETPTFSGSFSGFVGDDGAQAAQDFEWKSASYPGKISEKGSYEVYAWYTNGNRKDGNYGKNYTFLTPSNTAWTVGYTDPLDPSNPDSPFNPDNPMYPSQPGSPLNPNSGVGQAIAQASKFKPDDKSYNRASHDDNIEHFGQQSSISIQYEDAGVNVGDEEAVVGKRSLIGIESAGNVVNLGDAEMRAGNIGIENNGTNLGSAAEQAAIEAGLPATESYEAVPVVATAEQEDAVVESPFLSRLRQGQSAASDESEGEVSMGISIITAEPEDEDEEEKKNRAALMARSDRETHIGIETIGGGVNMAAAVR